MFSFMDGFSGYNQIKIAPEDQEKKTFTCSWGSFCWNVIPFGLKNVVATYQWAMTTIFHDMMHIFMEDYVDGILSKSHSQEEHLPILAKIFTCLEAFKVRLNPKKCAFGVKSTHYLLMHKIKLTSKIEMLKYLLRKTSLTGRLAKWVIILSELNIEYVDRKVIKGQSIADQFADAPIEISNPISVEFPNMHIL